jgi:hypothetical protein
LKNPDINIATLGTAMPAPIHLGLNLDNKDKSVHS